MSTMQNLTATSAANLQLFSKALQESAQQGADGPEVHNHQQIGHQNQTAISAADLQQFMLSQLDQQLYLSQLTSPGFGTTGPGGPETSTSSALFPSANSDSATTTASNGTSGAEGEMILKPQQLKGEFGASSSNPALSGETAAAAQLAQQNLMEQLLEAAAGGGAGQPLDPQNGGQTAEEIGQLMAQLMAANGCGAGGQGADQLQAQLAQQLINGRGDVQSPSQQQAAAQLSLLDQLQVLQILGGQGNVAGLADLLAGANGAALSQFAANSMGHDFGGAGGMMKGGSPNKDADNYCDICNKNVCNRYFLKTHKERKHGIFSGSPTKGGADQMQQFFPHLEEPGRAQSVTLQQQQRQQRDSPSAYQHHQQQRQKQSLSSTPGLGSGVSSGGGTAPPTGSALNEADSQQQQQLMSQCIMQQLAAQLGLQNGQDSRPPALIEQILGGGLPLADLLQQQNGGGQQSASPTQSPTGMGGGGGVENFACTHCARHFPSQSALFQHQLSEHIGLNEQQEMRWAAGIGGGGGGEMPGGAQQQFLGLLGSPSFPGGNNAASLLLPNFGQLNASDMDGAAMLAKLSAELAAVSSQGGGPCGGGGQPQHGGGLLQQNGAGGGGGGGGQMPNKMPTQKRQYQSTSKNFCDLCNKEVCNKYFLRTHMLKMHNIVIDENKMVIANIDTAEKERRGEVKFRCEICGQSMQTRELLKLHKREVHGMQPIGPHPMHGTPPSSKSGSFGSHHQRVSMETAIGSGGGGGADGARKLSSAGTFTLPTIGGIGGEHQRGEHGAMPGMGGGGGNGGMAMGAMKLETATGTAPNDENDQPPPMLGCPTKGDGGGGGGAAASALPSSVKQLLSQLIGSADPQQQLANAQQQGGGHFQMNNKREEDSDDHQQHLQNISPSPHSNNDANNNGGLKTCRFCGIYCESEQELELHQLVSHLDLVHSGLHNNNNNQQQEAEEKLVTQVALQMAEANSQKKKKTSMAAALRKSSAASSGGASSSSHSSSSSAASSAPSASSSAAALGHPQQQQPSPKAVGGHRCGQCKRTYKSVAKLEAHQRMVHQHNFVAKISPLKRTITISPKKISKMLNCFSCMKCQRRFATKMECNEHVISAHFRPEHDNAGNQSPKRAKIDGGEEEGEEEEEEEEYEECRRQGLLREWVREVDGREREGEDLEEENDDGHLGRLVVDEGEDVMEGGEDGGKKENGNNRIGGPAAEGGSGDGKDGGGHRQMKQTAGTAANGKEAGGEKHSHTSGSTSPVSVQASHSSLILPEGFAQPLPDHQKPFLLQSFTVRPIHPMTIMEGGSGSGNGTAAECAQPAGGLLPEELVAYLPVRATLQERVRVTLELQPNPLIDAQVRHL